MKCILGIFLFIVAVAGITDALEQTSLSQDDTFVLYPPRIGILSLPSNFSQFNSSDYSYISDTYVKYFQQAGAEVFPISYTMSKKRLRFFMKNLSGLIITGGGANLMQRNDQSEGKEFTRFAEAGRYLIKIAKRLNNKGQYTPVWGTCLGFELLALSFSKIELRSLFNGESHLSNISLVESHFNRSSLLSLMTQNVLESIQNDTTGIFYFNHKNGFLPRQMKKKGKLYKHFRALAYSKDMNNRTFIAIAEAKKYPFYGIQFHSEKIYFNSERLEKDNLNQIQAIQYFANFFTIECLKSSVNQKKSQLRPIEKFHPIQIQGLNYKVYFFANYQNSSSPSHSKEKLKSKSSHKKRQNKTEKIITPTQSGDAKQKVEIQQKGDELKEDSLSSQEILSYLNGEYNLIILILALSFTLIVQIMAYFCIFKVKNCSSEKENKQVRPKVNNKIKYS